MCCISYFKIVFIEQNLKKPCNRLSTTLSLDVLSLLYVRQAVDSNPDILAEPDRFLPDKTTWLSHRWPLGFLLMASSVGKSLRF